MRHDDVYPLARSIINDTTSFIEEEPTTPPIITPLFLRVTRIPQGWDNTLLSRYHKKRQKQTSQVTPRNIPHFLLEPQENLEQKTTVSRQQLLGFYDKIISILTTLEDEKNVFPTTHKSIKQYCIDIKNLKTKMIFLRNNCLNPGERVKYRVYDEIRKESFKEFVRITNAL